MLGRMSSWTLPTMKNHVPTVEVDSERKRTLPTTNITPMRKSLAVLRVS